MQGGLHGAVMLLVGLALGLAVVPFAEEREPGRVFLGGEAVADVSVGRGATAEVLVEPANEVGRLKGRPLAGTRSRRAG